MKFKLLIFSFLITGGQLLAQQEQTLFNKARLRGAWGGPFFTTGVIKGRTGYGAGGSGGLVFNGVSIGLFGQGEAFDGFRRDNRDYALALGYGGLFLGYSVPTQKALHLIASVKIAGGATGLARKYRDWDFEFDEDDFVDGIFVATPEVGLELNLAHWMRFSATAGYRYVDGFEGIGDLGKKDLNAAVYGFTLRFGWFGHKK
jgi:hypothetical protein